MAGRGACGQLGHGDEESYCWPEPIEALRGVRVAAMAASECHSLVLTKEGEVLSFGEGYEGRPGLLPLHGGHVNMSVCFPAQITGLQTRGCIDPPPPSGSQADITLTAASAQGAAGGGPLKACCVHTRLRANILGVIRKRLLAIVRKYAGRNADAQMQVAALAAYKYL